MYTAKDIRNICLLGHGGDGKSALAESMLFLTKAIDRLGKRTDGNTTSDFDPEEIKRGYSISTAVLPVEYNKCKLNILDNPGYFAFSGEVAQSLRVADAGLICLTAKGGIAVGTERAGTPWPGQVFPPCSIFPSWMRNMPISSRFTTPSTIHTAKAWFP